MGRRDQCPHGSSHHSRIPQIPPLWAHSVYFVAAAVSSSPETRSLGRRAGAVAASSRHGTPALETHRDSPSCRRPDTTWVGGSGGRHSERTLPRAPGQGSRQRRPSRSAGAAGGSRAGRGRWLPLAGRRLVSPASGGRARRGEGGRGVGGRAGGSRRRAPAEFVLYAGRKVRDGVRDRARLRRSPRWVLGAGRPRSEEKSPGAGTAGGDPRDTVGGGGSDPPPVSLRATPVESTAEWEGGGVIWKWAKTCSSACSPALPRGRGQPGEPRDLVAWLKESDQVEGKEALTCASPDKMLGKALLKINGSDLNCSVPTDLPSQLQTSYVFLGIVLALIGAIFLLVLYLNRKGIKKWMHNIRDACRDHMEGYHYRYEINADPRLTNLSSNSD
ncbi:LOW QUALITY PROTEIN: hypothetical protein Nmel_004632, partial [Mimus melanotis]